MKKKVKKEKKQEKKQEESSIVQITVKKAQKNMHGLLDMTKLTQKKDAFVPCVIMDRSVQQEWLYQYEVRNLLPFKEIQKEEETTKLKILMNVMKLHSIVEKFQVHLTVDNLYYDVNGLLKIMDRDVYAQGMKLEEEDFLLSYKSLIAYALTKGKAFEDYKEGGASLFKGNAFLEKIWEQSDKEELVHLLFERYQIENEKNKKRYTKVEKTKWKGMRYGLLVMGVLSALLLVFLLYELAFSIPKKQRNIAAYEAYEANDYGKAMEIMEHTEVDEMSVSMSYILAKSSIEGSGLKENARTNALSQLSRQEKSAYNTYWIYLGRKEYEEAYGIADDFSDDRLMYFAYYVEYQSLSSNKELSATEKEKRKKELEEKLDKYTSQFEE